MAQKIKWNLFFTFCACENREDAIATNGTSRNGTYLEVQANTDKQPVLHIYASAGNTALQNKLYATRTEVAVPHDASESAHRCHPQVRCKCSLRLLSGSQ